MIVICPFNAEAKLLASVLPNCKKISDKRFLHSYSFNGGHVYSYDECGKSAVISALEQLKNELSNSRVLLFGSAGGLNPNLSLGDIFCCTHIKAADNSKELCLEALKGFNTASLLTVSTAVLSQHERQSLYKRYKADIADIEGYHFASWLLGLNRQPSSFGVIRFISDTAYSGFTSHFGAEIRRSLLKIKKYFIS